MQHPQIQQQMRDPRVAVEYGLDIGEESSWWTLTPSVETRAALTYAQETGEFFARSGYFTRRSNLESFLIAYTVSGAGLLRTLGRETRLTSGMLFFIDCREPQVYESAADPGAWHFLWTHVYGAACERYYRRFETLTGGVPAIALPIDNGAERALRRLNELSAHVDRTEADELSAHAILSCLMAEAVEAAEHRIQTAPPAYVVTVKQYLTAHYAQPITLDDLSKMAFVSKTHLLKQFQKAVGMSPNEYVKRLRVSTAKKLLQTTDRPIHVIARSVGLPHVSHFINTFKQLEGITPGDYRRTWQVG